MQAVLQMTTMMPAPAILMILSLIQQPKNTQKTKWQSRHPQRTRCAHCCSAGWLFRVLDSCRFDSKSSRQIMSRS